MLDWLGEQKRNYQKVMFTAGNHDFLFRDLPHLAKQMCYDREIIYLEDDIFEFEGLTFLGSPWTPKFYNWAFMETESGLADIYKYYPQVDVLFTHGPPLGTLDVLSTGPEKGKHVGSSALRDYVKKFPPKLHVFGHIHNQENPVVKTQDTLYINAAQVDDNNALKGHIKPIVVDTDTWDVYSADN